MSEATPETTSTDNSDYVDPMINVCLDDRYTLEELIGRGGAAAVYRAHDEKVGRSVAIKLPKNAGAFAEESKADFEREASRYTRLQHPNTLRLFDYGQTRDGQTYIVTELLSGQTLKERLDSLEEVGKIGIGVRRTISLMRDVTSALSEAHADGLVHRDLKPSNIFLQSLGGQEVVKVIDFGIAKDLQEATLTGSSTLWGTPLYMSPEQAQGKTIDARSDLYALGVIAFECLVGKPPFQGNTPYAILMQHIDSEAPTLAEAGCQEPVPQELEALIRNLLSKDSKDRVESADALIEELTRIEEIWSSLRLTAGSTLVGVRMNKGLTAIQKGVAALAVAAALAIGGWFAIDQSEPAAIPTDGESSGTVDTKTPGVVSVPEKSVPEAVPNEASAPSPEPSPKPELVLPKRVTFRLSSNPVGATVTIDEINYGATPQELSLEVASKIRTVKFEKRGYETLILSVPPGVGDFEHAAELKKKVPKRIRKPRASKAKGLLDDLKAQ